IVHTMTAFIDQPCDIRFTSPHDRVVGPCVEWHEIPEFHPRLTRQLTPDKVRAYPSRPCWEQIPPTRVTSKEVATPAAKAAVEIGLSTGCSPTLLPVGELDILERIVHPVPLC